MLASHWSQVAADGSGTDAENTFARILAKTPKLLFSSTCEPLDGWNTKVATEDPAAVVGDLARNRRLVIQASPALARSLRKAHLVDKLRLLVQPLITGTGPALFDPTEHIALTLTGSAPLATGAVALDYTLSYR